MYDGGKIIAGLVIFLGLVTFPIWYTWGSGGPGSAPEIKTPANEQACVESKEFMAAWHMDLLNQWRDSVVREGNRISNTANGRAYEMSLSGGCMDCHANKTEFCDKCHDYAGVDPYCWDCHIEPIED